MRNWRYKQAAISSASFAIALTILAFGLRAGAHIDRTAFVCLLINAVIQVALAVLNLVAAMREIAGQRGIKEPAAQLLLLETTVL